MSKVTQGQALQASGDTTDDTGSGNRTVTGDLTVTEKFGCNGADPQAAATVAVALDTTAATDTTPFGFSQAQADGLIELVNQIRDALIANGIAVEES